MAGHVQPHLAEGACHNFHSAGLRNYLTNDWACTTSPGRGCLPQVDPWGTRHEGTPQICTIPNCTDSSKSESSTKLWRCFSAPAALLVSGSFLPSSLAMKARLKAGQPVIWTNKSKADRGNGGCLTVLVSKQPEEWAAHTLCHCVSCQKDVLELCCAWSTV
eukprot:1153510-Pelagomonas_calceolata.AAC.1